MPLTPPPSAPPAAPDAPGASPSRANPTTFRTLADAFVTWQVGFRTSLADLRAWLATYISWAATNITELDALQADVATKQETATAAATTATTKAGEASTSAAIAEASRSAIDDRIYPGTYDPATPPTTKPISGSPSANGDEFSGADGYRYARIGGVWVNQTAAAAASAESASGSAAAALADRTQADTDAAMATAKALEAQNYAAASATGAKFFDTIALGNAGVADTLTFGVKSGGSDGLTRPTIYRRESAGVSTKIYEVIAGAELDTTLGAFQDAFLPQSVTPVSAPASTDRTYRFATAISAARRLQRLSIYAVTAGWLTLGSWSSGNALVARVRLRVVAGLNTITLKDLPSFSVPAGGFISVYGPQALGLTAAAGSNTTSYQTVTGDAVSAGGSPAWGGVSSTNRLEIGLRFGGAGTGTSLRSELDEIAGEAADVRPGAALIIGNAGTFIAGTGITSRTTAFVKTSTTDEIVTHVEGFFGATGTLLLKVFSVSGNDYIQVGDDVPVQITATGLQTIALERPMIVRAGQVRGFYADTNVVGNGISEGVLAARQDAFVDNSGDAGGNVRSFTDTTATNTAMRAIRFYSRPFSTDSAFDGAVKQIAKAVQRTTENAFTVDTQPITGYVLIWILGQSNGAGRAPTRSAKLLASGHYKYRRSDTSLQALADPTGNDALALSGSGTGSSGPAIAKMIEILSRGRLRVIIVNSCEGGTALTTATTPNWSASGTLRAQAASDLANALTAAAAAGLRISGAAIYLNQGESDGDVGTTGAAYITAFQSFATWARGVIGAKAPILMARIGRKSSGDTSEYQTIRGAQDDIAETETGVYQVHSSEVDMAGRGLMIDEFHYNITGLEEIGDSVGIGVMSYALGLRPTGYTA